MIITKTPHRLSLLGGGTDYVSYLNSGNIGLCLGGTIDKYNYVHCRYLPKFFEHNSYIAYSQIERVASNKDIAHRVIRTACEYWDLTRGVEIVNLSDIPSKTGSGSSSSFVVGLMHALAVLHGQRPCPETLAKMSIVLEQDYLKETVGLQDTVFAAIGGFRAIRFSKNRGFVIEETEIRDWHIKELEKHLMLFFSGIERVSSNIAQTYVPQLTQKNDVQNRLVKLAEKGIVAIQEYNFEELGRLMHENWGLKRSLSPSVSNSILDDIYKKALTAGAWGGKITGAGGGGAVLLVVEPRKRRLVREALKHLIEIPFRFTKTGSKVILKNGSK